MGAQHPAILSAAKRGLAKFDIAAIARKANLHESTVRVFLHNEEDVSVETRAAIRGVIGLDAPSTTRRSR